VERYTKYKDTGVRTIGEIPANWETIKTAYAFSFGRGLSISRENMSEEGIPCVHYGEIHARYGFAVDPAKDKLPCIDESYLETAPQALLKYGDYCFVGSSEDTDGSGNFTYLNSDIPAFAGSDTIILRAKREINHRFVAYMFDSLSFREQIRPEVYGVKVFHPTQSIIKRVVGIYPSLEEQAAIAAHLDRRTAKIDGLLADLARQAEMLDTYKRELIAEAVTKGIDKSAAMKDSGVDWIGETPAHWDTRRIKYLYELRQERNFLSLEEVELISLYTDLGVVKHSDLEKTTGNKAQNADGYKHVYKNDIVVNIILCWMGAVGMSDYDGVTSPAYDVYKPKKNLVCSRYYHYLFRTPKFSGECFKVGRGIMMMRWRTYSDQFKAITVQMPPIEEQEKIAAYLDEKTAQVEGLIADITAQIEKLKQYRQIVIHDAVTGKVKVTEG
jgi:type I restriction enzyme S subunit